MPGVPERDVRPNPVAADERRKWTARVEAVAAAAPANAPGPRVREAAAALIHAASPSMDEVLHAQLLVQRLDTSWPAAAQLLRDLVKRRAGEIQGCPPWLV